MKTFCVTSPIYYVNALPHIGTAYTTLICDCIARFKRLEGYEVKFLTGTDEHGQKIEQSALKAGLSPQEFTDKISAEFKSLFHRMHISSHDFIRTTSPEHKASATSLWKKLQENGHIYLDKYSGWYAVRDESFYSEAELINGKAPTGADVEWVSEESYFFDLSKWQDTLLSFYKANPSFVTPKSRFNEIINFVQSGLNDLSISRTSFKWGVLVPGNEAHVMYVWVEALSYYISALGYPKNTEDFKKFWPADLHVVGKDITKFHAIYWPAILMAAGVEPPKQIVSHGWWLSEGEKISKSLGNVIDPVDLIEKYGLDQMKYYLLRDMSFGNDGNFVKSLFIQRNNSELSNKLGNLIQRSLSMIYKNCDKKIPVAPYNAVIIDKAEALFSEIKPLFDAHEFHKVLEIIMHFVDTLNIYIDQEAPWALKKTNPEKMNEVLYTIVEALRYVGILLIPFIPDSAHKILDIISVPIDTRNFAHLNKTYAAQAVEINEPKPIFPRIEEELA